MFLLRLLERDREVALRATTRRLTFPDGKPRDVTAFRFVWRWVDRLAAYPFSPGQEVLLADVQRHAERTGSSLDDALGEVAQAWVAFIETQGGDVTDEDLEVVIAAKAALRRVADTA